MNMQQLYFVWNRHGRCLGELLARSSNQALQLAKDKYNDSCVMVQAEWHYCRQHDFDVNKDTRAIIDSVHGANIITYLPPPKVYIDYSWNETQYAQPPVRNKTMFRARSQDRYHG